MFLQSLCAIFALPKVRASLNLLFLMTLGLGGKPIRLKSIIQQMYQEPRHEHSHGKTGIYVI